MGGHNVKTWKDFQRGEGNEEPLQPKQKVRGRKRKKRGYASTALVPIEKMLPGLRISTNALVVYKERQELYDHIICGYSETHRRLRELQTIIEKQKVRPEAKPQGAEETAEQEPSTALALLFKKRDEIALMHSQDALETVRVQLGLDKLRDNLLRKLREKLSPEHGLQLLSAWAKKRLGKSCDSIGEVNELFPHLTLSELAFLPLLEDIPATLVLYGTTFDATTVASQVGLKDFDGSDARRRVPQQVWATVHGLAYVLDNYQPERDDKGIAESDPYAVLGLTGIREDVELVEFKNKVKRIVQKLVLLMMSNARLYERLWISSSESLQVGLGRIARLALERTMGQEGKDAQSVSLSVGIEMLDAIQRKRFDDERQCLEQTIGQASIYDLGRDVMLRLDEKIRLVGILNQVPYCLVREQPFTGFIQPYGVCINFIAPDGKIVETCPFSPVHSRETVEILYSETKDAGRENRTLAFLFHELFSWIQGKVMDRFAENPSALSLLEATALKLWLERHVVLQPLPSWSLVPVRDFWQHIFHYTTTGKDVVAKLTSKIGLQEAQQIVMTLQLPDVQLLERVKRVVKTQSIHSLASMMEGMAIEGSYEPDSQTIILIELPEMLYGDASPIQKAARSFQLLHECGEAVWTMLSESDKEQWKQISWPPKARQKKAKHFLTFYARHRDEKEDFCDHLAAYILHGPEFRLATKKAQPLRRKYQFLRRIVAFLTGSATEFPLFIPWTIEQIHGALDQEVKRLELEEAVAAEEALSDEVWEGNMEHIFEIRKSFEQLLTQEEKEVDAQDIDDPEERKLAEQEDEDEDEEYEEAIEVKDGWIEMHEIRTSVTDALDSVYDRDRRGFKNLRDKVTEYLLDNDWQGIETMLNFLDEEDKEEVMSLLREIDTRSQKP
jgi:hypothetical protein